MVHPLSGQAGVGLAQRPAQLGVREPVGGVGEEVEHRVVEPPTRRNRQGHPGPPSLVGGGPGARAVVTARAMACVTFP